MIPDRISDDSLRTDIPEAYRDHQGCMNLLERYISVEQTFRVIGYIGHL